MNAIQNDTFEFKRYKLSFKAHQKTANKKKIPEGKQHIYYLSKIVAVRGPNRYSPSFSLILITICMFAHVH